MSGDRALDYAEDEKQEALFLDTYREALKAGLIEAPTDQIVEWKPPDIPPAMREALEIMPVPRPHAIDVQTQDPARDTAAQRYQEHISGIEAPFANLTAYECARFHVPENSLGVIRTIWTWAEAVDTVPITPARQCGTPYDPAALARVGIELNWALQLFQSYEYQLGPLWTGPILQIPGTPHPDLPFWPALTRAWGTPDAGPFLLVPGGFTLRLFLSVLNGARDLRLIVGKIWGYTQPARNLDVVQNARHGWQW
jgi:hypothetical protein